MKTNHGSVINRRMRDNYAEVLKDMTADEKAWAEKFERMEYAIERGFGQEAITLAKQLNPEASREIIEAIREDVKVKDRCNPVKAERTLRQSESRRSTNNANHSDRYDAYDWHRDAGTILDDDGNETERGITVSPEDALIAALDTARSHGISITEFINNPVYHTPERKAGRPKKGIEV
jgi:hypothetical protein